jgi:branched-subunit amino acid transport protein
MLPLVLLHNVKLPQSINGFLSFIPFAALGALIFPGTIYSTGDNIAAAVVGSALSVLFAWRGVNLVIVVGAGIAGAFIVSTLL